jgi:hypothetical protein
MVVAEHPADPETSSCAVLAVFKPIVLNVSASAPPGVVRVIAGNADLSLMPFGNSYS